MGERLHVPESDSSPERADALVEAFLWRAALPSTRRSYRRAIADFRAADGASVLAPAPEALLAYRASLIRRNRSASTINLHFAALRGLFDFLVERDVLPSNPARRPDLRSLPTRRAPAGALPAAQLEALLAACDDGTDAGVRDRAVILLAAAGLDRMQIAAIRRGGEHRPFAPELCAAIEAWTERHPGYASDPLFSSLSNNRAGGAALSGSSINLIFKRRARRAGIANVTPRAVRGGRRP